MMGRVRMQSLLLLLLWSVLLRLGYGFDSGDGDKLQFNPPIFINNFNRLIYLRRLLQFFTSRGYRKLHILDNNSTYPPLLRFYRDEDGSLRRAGVHVHLLGRNYGHTSLWLSGVGAKFGLFGGGGGDGAGDAGVDGSFVLTDPDVLPDARAPRGFLDRFREELIRWPVALKVGCALRLDDIPQGYPLRREVQLVYLIYLLKTDSHYSIQFLILY